MLVEPAFGKRFRIGPRRTKRQTQIRIPKANEWRAHVPRAPLHAEVGERERRTGIFNCGLQHLLSLAYYAPAVRARVEAPEAVRRQHARPA